MHHTQNPAGQGGADCNSQRDCNPYTRAGGKNKAPASRRLDRAAAHWSTALPDTAVTAALLKALKRRGGA